ncbi:OHCU decarboxylase-domain-containing protein [Phakopsora pachyrhizi]|uniref:gluconokinase n=1 Tax=Phakopsora pachyrhizi TaxID=170000 RepID=A0AAV0BK08_PHAPC|nr:OHCU decarboxylase-domain-containing protein [Phakopsora pachyrhizi]CAH7686477.1 OHCU decarboxylase-domain-containing protein [Phakopsora pachyrhizi]
MAIFTHPTLIIVMGVSGCGSTVVGKELAKFLRVSFIDADDFHSQENIAKMKSGVPLDDQDRFPWLKRVREKGIEELQNLAASSSNLDSSNQKAVVIACSALKRKYRQTLSTLSIINNTIASPDDGFRVRTCFLYLKVSHGLLKRRLEQRKDHFMGPSMLESQLKDLEEPGVSEEENITWAVSIAATFENGDQRSINDIAVDALDALWEREKQSFDGLPPIQDLLGDTARNSSDLEYTLAKLFETSSATREELLPRLKALSLKSTIRNYVELIKCCYCIVMHDFSDRQKENFLGSHPRIGEVKGLSKLSSKEQGNQNITDPNVLEKLKARINITELNELYETIYPGLRYVTFVNGRSRMDIAIEMEELLDPNKNDGITKAKVHNHDDEWNAELARGIDAIFMIARSRLWLTL